MDKTKIQCEINLIYIVESGDSFAADLIDKLKQAGYRVCHFLDLNEFERACDDKLPAIIIMDLAFSKDDNACVAVLTSLKNRLKNCPPVIFSATRDDVATRLAAARAGVSRYFCKPLNSNKLLQTIQGLTERLTDEPFRVLLIDDDEVLLTYYATVLREEGMEVEVLTEVMESLNVLSRFKPDVVVLDIYMPECSGLELAQVIRQDDEWALMPIVFLSSETSINAQLTAMHLGGDDFLVKPVAEEYLISAIGARARRSRWANRTNNELNTVLRENKFHLATMDQHDIVSTADITGQITSVNDQFCKISGYSREELIGQNHRILKSEYHSNAFYREMWDTISQGKVWHGTICNLTKTGEEYWVMSTIVPFLDDQGIPYKYISARTDVTALSQSEERLHRSQVFANIGTWDWDLSTNSLFWSESIWPLFGYQQELTETTYQNFMSAVHPDDRLKLQNAVSCCIEQGHEYNIEHRVIWPDGSVHWMHEIGNVTRNEKGKPLHMLGMVQDITARKKSELLLIEQEMQLREAKNDAVKANLAKSHFLSSMSHELRTPMNAIMGFSQLLKMEKAHSLSDSQRDNVDEILRAGQHLLELINEVLDLAKIEAGRITLSIETVVLSEIITESLQLITPLAEQRGIEISLFIDGQALKREFVSQQQRTVLADKTRLKQILLNLLSNAVKYNSDNGKLTIACQHKGKDKIRVSISDTGAGITSEQQTHLFKAFERLGADKTDIEGTGIGLVITKNIIELMSGSIGLQSQPGKGTTFWIELPVGAILDETSVHQDNLEEQKEPKEQTPQKHIKPEYSVLYIEDNPANLRLVSQLLERKGNIKLWCAHEGLQGFELALEQKPNLILLDINLPGMNGFEVLKLLRKQEKTRNIPVLAISANAMPTDIKKGLAAGFNDYITKPIDIKELLHAIESVLQR